MLLVRLLETEIAEYWPILKFAIGKALPPIAGESGEKMNNILRALLLGKLQCWVVTENNEEGVFRSVITTSLLEDGITDTTNLLIYTIFAFKKMTDEDVDAMEKGLAAYAKSKNCNRAIAYTNSTSVQQMLLRQGFGENWHYLTRDL